MTTAIEAQPRGWVESRRNLIPDPRFATIGNWNQRWFGTGGAGSYAAYDAAWAGVSKRILYKTWSAAPSQNGDTGINYTNRVPVNAGWTYTLGYLIGSEQSGKSAASAQIVWADAAGATISIATGTLAGDIVPGNLSRVSVTAQAPAGAVTAGIIFDVDGGSTWRAGDRLYIADPCFDYVPDYVYVDGTLATTTANKYVWQGTPNASGSYGYVPDPATFMRPLMLLAEAHETSRTSRNVLHSVIGRADPVPTLRPASTRSGQLKFLFSTEAEAANCVDVHSRNVWLYMSDSDNPTLSMFYVLDGKATRTLDPETLTRWVVSIDYQEIKL